MVRWGRGGGLSGAESPKAKQRLSQQGLKEGVKARQVGEKLTAICQGPVTKEGREAGRPG